MMIQTFLASMPVFVCGLFAMLLLLDLRGRVERRCLSVFFCVATILYMGHLLFFSRKVEWMAFSDTLYAFAHVAVFPLYYIYIVALTQSRATICAWRTKMVLLPAVVCGVAVGVLYAQMDQTEVARFVDVYLYRGAHAPLERLAWWQAIAHDVAKVIFALQLVPIAVMGSRRIAQFNQRVEANYADTDGRVLHNLHALLWLFLVTTLVSMVSLVIGRQWFGSSNWLLAVPALIFSTLLFFVGRSGLWQTFSVEDLEQVERDVEVAPIETIQSLPSSPTAVEALPAPAAAAPVPPSVSARRKKQMVARIVNEKLYLRPDLKLNELALALGTNRTYLAQAISGETGNTFCDFVNQLRIEEALRLQEEEPRLPMADLVARCGFSNYSSFHRNYVKFAPGAPPVSK